MKKQESCCTEINSKTLLHLLYKHRIRVFSLICLPPLNHDSHSPLTLVHSYTTSPNIVLRPCIVFNVSMAIDIYASITTSWRRVFNFKLTWHQTKSLLLRETRGAPIMIQKRFWWELLKNDSSKRETHSILVPFVPRQLWQPTNKNWTQWNWLTSGCCCSFVIQVWTWTLCFNWRNIDN